MLNLARSEPFLSVEEIAATVETTPRYVRTSLSEAGLSLTKLRRQHAQNMKQRLSIDFHIPEASGTGMPVFGVFGEAGVQSVTGSVRVAQIVDAETATMLGAKTSTPLLEISRVRVGDERPLFVNQLVTTKHLLVSDAMFTSDRPLIELLGLCDEQDVAFAKGTLDVVRGNEYLCQSLHVAADDPIIRCGNLLIVAGEPVAIQFNYFDGTRVRLILGSAPDNALRITERYIGGR